MSKELAKRLPHRSQSIGLGKTFAFGISRYASRSGPTVFESVGGRISCGYPLDRERELGEAGEMELKIPVYPGQVYTGPELNWIFHKIAEKAKEGLLNGTDIKSFSELLERITKSDTDDLQNLMFYGIYRLDNLDFQFISGFEYHAVSIQVEADAQAIDLDDRIHINYSGLVVVGWNGARLLGASPLDELSCILFASIARACSFTQRSLLSDL